MPKSAKPEHTTNVRLAESDYAAVDMCHCGALQVHTWVIFRYACQLAWC
jgi:hypothetical protein